MMRLLAIAGVALVACSSSQPVAARTPHATPSIASPSASIFSGPKAASGRSYAYDAGSATATTIEPAGFCL